MTSDEYRTRMMIAIHRANDAGFIFFALALTQLLAREEQQ